MERLIIHRKNIKVNIKNESMNNWLKERDIIKYNETINSTQISNHKNGITKNGIIKNGIFIPYLSLPTKCK